MTIRLLLVEDDAKLASLLCRLFAGEGYEVTLATDVAGAKRAPTAAIDLAVIDRMLPDGDGVDLCCELRRTDFEGPILMLTARGETKDRVQALDLGADDYLTKPFELEELLARVRALLRRGPRLAGANVGPLHVDYGRRNAFVRGALVPLTSREFDVLAYLARRIGQLVSKVELMDAVWTADEIAANVVEVHMSRIRDKLGPHARLIKTVRGRGYSLDADELEEP